MRNTVHIEKLNVGTMSLPGFMVKSKGALRRITLPVSAFLLEIPGHGPILVDAGWGRLVSPEGVYDRQSAAEKMPLRVAEMYRPVTPPGKAITEQLNKRGLRPEDVEAVILTTLEPEHATGLRELRGARCMLMPELERFWSGRTVYAVRQSISSWDGLGVMAPYYRADPDAPAKLSIDVFGDGSLKLVNTKGISYGSATVKVEKPDGSFALLISDAVYSRGAMEREEMPPLSFHTNENAQSIRWIKEKAASPLCRGVFFGHDPEDGLQELTF